MDGRAPGMGNIHIRRPRVSDEAIEEIRRVHQPSPHESKDVTIEIKWGLGTLSLGIGLRQRRNVKLYHVVINGHTLHSALSEDEAKAWAYDWMKRNPVKTHHIK